MLRTCISFITVIVAVSNPYPAGAQSTASAPTPVSSPAALALANQALRAVAGLTPLVDITMQAIATYIAGSDEETGTATLVARGNQQGLVTLDLSGGERQEVRNGTEGAWTGPDGTQHVMALHNCWVDAPWLFPALILQALQSDPTLGVAYLGPATILAHPDDPASESNGLSTVHLQFFHLVPGQTPDVTAQIQSLSGVDLYLDPQSLLPLALNFSTHPDQDFLQSLPVEIRFANYQTIGGILVPLRIQKFLQNTLLLDLAVASAALNSGVSPTLFATPAIPTGGAQ